MYKACNAGLICSNIAFKITNKYFKNAKYMSITVLGTKVI